MKPMEVGVITSLKRDEDPFKYVGDFGLRTCQLVNWNPRLWTTELADRAKKLARHNKVEVAAVWAGYTGKCVWNFIDGPATLGLVPAKTRAMRVRQLKAGADFCARLGAPAIITHLGFIPEDPKDRKYAPTVKAVRDVALHCRKRGIGFWFETGQETPVAMLRLIEDVGTGNLGINLDPANLILYGKASPVDALDVFGKYVRCLHAKDGIYPTDGRNLGHEEPLGKGKVNFPLLIKGLAKIRYKGALVIEREISGPRQARDIRAAVTYLRGLVGRVRTKR